MKSRKFEQSMGRRRELIQRRKQIDDMRTARARRRDETTARANGFAMPDPGQPEQAASVARQAGRQPEEATPDQILLAAEIANPDAPFVHGHPHDLPEGLREQALERQKEAAHDDVADTQYRRNKVTALRALAIRGQASSEDERRAVQQALDGDVLLSRTAQISNYGEDKDDQYVLGRYVAESLLGDAESPEKWWAIGNKKMPKGISKQEAYRQIWREFASMAQQEHRDYMARQEARRQMAVGVAKKINSYIDGKTKWNSFSQDELLLLNATDVNPKVLNRVKQAARYIEDYEKSGSIYDADSLRLVFNALVEDETADEATSDDEKAIAVFMDWWAQRVSANESGRALAAAKNLVGSILQAQTASSFKTAFSRSFDRAAMAGQPAYTGDKVKHAQQEIDEIGPVYGANRLSWQARMLVEEISGPLDDGRERQLDQRIRQAQGEADEAFLQEAREMRRKHGRAYRALPQDAERRQAEKKEKVFEAVRQAVGMEMTLDQEVALRDRVGEIVDESEDLKLKRERETRVGQLDLIAAGDTKRYAEFRSKMVTAMEDAENDAWKQAKEQSKQDAPEWMGDWLSSFNMAYATRELGRMAGDTATFFIPIVGGGVSMASLTQRAVDEAAGRQGLGYDRAQEIAAWYGPIAWSVEKIAFGGIGKGAGSIFGLNKFLMDAAIKRLPNTIAGYYTRSTMARVAGYTALGTAEEGLAEPLMEAILKTGVANPALFGKEDNNYLENVLDGLSGQLEGQGIEGWPEFRREVTSYVEDPNMLFALITFSAALSSMGAAEAREESVRAQHEVQALKSSGLTDQQVAEWIETKNEMTLIQKQQWLMDQARDNWNKDPEGTAKRILAWAKDVKMKYNVDELAKLEAWEANEALGLVPQIRQGKDGKMLVRLPKRLDLEEMLGVAQKEEGATQTEGRQAQEEAWVEMTPEAANVFVNTVLGLQFENSEYGLLAAQDLMSADALVGALEKRGWIVEDMGGALTMEKAEALAKLANSRIAALVKAGMTEEQARARQDASIGTAMPLGLAADYAQSLQDRAALARARGELQANENAISQANVATFRVGGQVQRILRYAKGEARLLEIIEEIHEQAVLDYCWTNGLSVEDFGEELQALQEYINDTYGKDERYQFMQMDKPATQREVIEAFSRLGRSRFVGEVMTSEKTPSWVKRLLSYVIQFIKGYASEIALAENMRRAYEAGKMDQGLLDVLNSMEKDLDDVFALADARLDGTAYARQLMQRAQEQAALDAAYGRGEITNTQEILEQEQVREQATKEQERKEEESVRKEIAEEQKIVEEETGKKADVEEVVKRRLDAERARMEAEIAATGRSVEESVKGVFLDDVGTKLAEHVYMGRVELGRLQLSQEIQQFKKGADPVTGEVKGRELVGRWRYTSDPIVVWKRKDGRLEIISGRHRFAHATRENVPWIATKVFEENEEFTAEWALDYDMECNIQDNQAQPDEIAAYVRRKGYGIAECERRGLYRKGTDSFSACELACYAGDFLWNSFLNWTTDARHPEGIRWKDAWKIAAKVKDHDKQARGADYYLKNGRDIAKTLTWLDNMYGGVVDDIAKRLTGTSGGGGVQMNLFGEAEIDEHAVMADEMSKFTRFWQNMMKDASRLARAAVKSAKAGRTGMVGVEVSDAEMTKKLGAVRAAMGARLANSALKEDLKTVMQNSLAYRLGKPLELIEGELRALLGRQEVRMMLMADNVLLAARENEGPTARERREQENELRLDLVVSDALTALEEFRKEEPDVPLGSHVRWSRDVEEDARASQAEEEAAEMARQQQIEETGLLPVGAPASDDGGQLSMFSIAKEGEHVVFDAAQIKSATDNAGSFGREDDRINFVVSGERSQTFAEYDRNGYTYMDPADGKRKAVIDVRDARMKRRPSVAKHQMTSAGMGAVLECEELFRAYPDLYGYRVDFINDPDNPGVRAFANAPKRRITVNLAAAGDVTGVLLHEIQHVVQAHEGFALGANAGAIVGNAANAAKYIDAALGQLRRRKDKWAAEKISELEQLKQDVLAGVVSPAAVYWASSGEQEASRAEHMRHREPGAKRQEIDKRLDKLTVPVTGNITDLGGITFDMGRFGQLTAKFLHAKGDWIYDTRVFKLRESLQRLAGRLEQYRGEQEGGKTGLQMFADALALIETTRESLPGNYAFGLEPYKIWGNFFAQMYGLGVTKAEASDATMELDKVLEAIPMKGWDDIMFKSIRKQFLEWMEANDNFTYQMYARNLKAGGFKGSALKQELFRSLFPMKRKDNGRAFGYEWAQSYGNEKLARMMGKFLRRASEQLDAFRKDKMLGRIRKVVANASPKRKPGEKPVYGKIGAEESRKLETYMRLIEMTPTEYDEWHDTYFYNDQLGNNLPKWEAVPGDTVCPVTLYDYEGNKTTYDVTKDEMETFADFGSMTPERAERCAQAIGEFVTMGRTSWENAREQRKLYIASMANPVMALVPEMNPSRAAKVRRQDKISACGGATLDPFGFMQNLGQQFDALSGVAEFRGWAKDMLQRCADASVSIEKADYDMLHFIRDEIARLFGIEDQYDQAQWMAEWKRVENTGIQVAEQPPDFEERARDEYVENVTRLLRFKLKHHGIATTAAGVQNFLQNNKTLTSEAADKIWSAFGSITRELDEKQQRLKQSHPVQNFWTEEEWNRYGDMTSWVDVRAQKLYDSSDWGKRDPATGAQLKQPLTYTLELSKDAAAYLILLAEQKSYDSWRLANGFTDDVIDELEDWIGQEGVEFARKLREKLNERSTVIQSMIERRYGVPFPLEENYFRAFFDTRRDLKQQDIAEGMQTGDAAGGGAYGFIRTRRRHSERPALDVGATSAFVAAMREQNVFIHCGEISRDMREFLNYQDGNKRMSDVLREVVGKGAEERLAEWADSLDRTGANYIAGSLEITRLLTRASSAAAHGTLSGRISSLSKQATAVFNSLYGVDDVEFLPWMRSFMRVMTGRGIMTVGEMSKQPEIYTRDKSDVVSLDRALNSAENLYASKLERINDAGMNAMTKADVKANSVSSAVLYDAVYRSLEGQGLSQQEMHDFAMQAVRTALEVKAQPLNHRQKSLLAKNKFFALLGPLYLMSEGIVTIGRVYSLAKAGRYRQAGILWLTHGTALAVIQALIDLMTDDEKRRKKRTLWGYVAMAILGPLTGIPLVGDAVAYGAAQGLEKIGVNVPIYRASVVPFADSERFIRDLSGLWKLFDSDVSWQDKGVGVMKFLQSAGIIVAAATMNTTQGRATMAALALAIATAANLAEFGLKMEKNVEKWLE